MKNKKTGAWARSKNPVNARGVRGNVRGIKIKPRTPRTPHVLSHVHHVQSTFYPTFTTCTPYIPRSITRSIVRGERGIERGLYVVYAGSKLNRVHSGHPMYTMYSPRDLCFLPMLLLLSLEPSVG